MNATSRCGIRWCVHGWHRWMHLPQIWFPRHVASQELAVLLQFQNWSWNSLKSLPVITSSESDHSLLLLQSGSITLQSSRFLSLSLLRRWFRCSRALLRRRHIYDKMCLNGINEYAFSKQTSEQTDMHSTFSIRVFMESSMNLLPIWIKIEETPERRPYHKHTWPVHHRTDI